MSIVYNVIIDDTMLPVVFFENRVFKVIQPLFLCVKGSTPIECIGEDIHNVRWAADLFRLLSKQTLEQNHLLREDVESNDFSEPHTI